MDIGSGGVDNVTNPVIRAPKIPDNWLQAEIQLLSYVDGSQPKFQDIDGSYLEVNDFVTKYNDGDYQLSKFLTSEANSSRHYKHITDLKYSENMTF